MTSLERLRIFIYGHVHLGLDGVGFGLLDVLSGCMSL